MTTCEKTRTMIDSGAPLAAESRHLDECGACRAYAAETSALLNLLAATPRVEAPPDFEFRLRARIATAKSEQSSIWKSLIGLWSGPMGWSRAAATMAAVAVIASAVTLYATRSNRSAPEAIATRVGSQVTQPLAPPAMTRPEASVAPSAPSALENVGSSNQADVAARSSARTTSASRASHLPLTSVARELPASPKNELDLGAMQGTRVVVESRGARPMVTIPQVTYGAQRTMLRQNASTADGAVTQAVF